MIREATPADERALRTLDHANWTLLASPAPVPPPEREFEVEGTLVAEVDGGFAGYVKLGPALRLESTDHVLEIKGLTVDEAHRRRGVGRALMHAAIETAKAAGARKLILRVLGHNTGARDLYAACGFEVEGVLRDFFYLEGRYVDDVFMALDLTDAGSPAST